MIVKQEAPQINEIDLTYGEPTVTYDTTDGLSINSTMNGTNALIYGYTITDKVTTI